MGIFHRSSRKASQPSIAESTSSTSSVTSPISTTSGGQNIKWSTPSPLPQSNPFTPKPNVPAHRPRVSMPRAPDPEVDPAAYLRSINAVRERCSLVCDKARRDELRHFRVDMARFEDAANFVVSIIKV
jgi:hypothetical protein